MIRRLELNDIDTIVKLEEEIFGESLGFEMLSEEINNPLIWFRVIEIDNKVIGYIGGYFFMEDGEILNFVIDENYQHQGYVGYQPTTYFLNMNYVVANDSNADVTTMTLRHDPETNAQYGYALSGQDVWNNQPNLQQSYSMSEDSETYTDDSFCYFVDDSSSDSDDDVDFLNSSLHRRPFEFM